MIVRDFFAATLLLAFMGDSANSQDTLQDPVNVLQSVAIPETVSLGGQKLVLKASLSRELHDPATSVSCHVRAVDSTSLPPSLTMDSVWIVGRKQTWKGRLSESGSVGFRQFLRERRPPTIAAVFKDGPNLTGRDTVDVVVQLRLGWKTDLIRASNQHVVIWGIMLE